MLSKSLTDGLEAYDIGPKIRALRTCKGLGLAQLGEHSGLSSGMLSRIERGQVFPTLPTLLRIAMVFGVGLEHFFSDAAEGPIATVVRARDRMRLPNTTTGNPDYFFESLDFPVPDRPIEVFFAEFASGGSDTPHAHPGPEVIYVITGCLELSMRGEVYRLETGDSMYFDAGHDHSYRRKGAARCTAIVAVCPGGAARSP